MKIPKLIRIETLAAVALGTLLMGCGPAKPPEADPKAPAAPAPPATQAAPAAPTAPATPAPTEPTPPATATATATVPTTGLIHYDASPTGSKVRMEGTSTMHDWWMESVIVGGSLEADASFPATPGKVTAKSFIPVRSFKSSGGKRMDGKMQEAMSEPKFKNIEFTLIDLKPKTGGAANEFEAIGTLTIIGNTVTNTLPVNIEKTAEGKLKVTGTTPLKMSDYQLKSPEIKIPLLPDISVGDSLKINFEWLLVPKKG